VGAVGRRCVYFGVRWRCGKGSGYKYQRGPEDDSVESKHVALISHFMFNITTVVF